MILRKPIVLVATVAVVAAVFLWLRRPPAARAAFARDAAAPYARAAVALRGTDGASGASTEDPEEAPPHPAQLAALRAENDRLRAGLLLLDALEEENASLRLHLAFVQRNPSLIAAEVIPGGGGDAWSRRLRLGKGRNQGVPLHAPVLAPEGLVGHVVELTDETADVLLVSDPNSHVACQLPDASGPPLHGIASGSGTGPAQRLPGVASADPVLRVDYLDAHGSPATGGLAVTSGLGGRYPAGLPIGTVRDVSLDSSGLYRRVLLAPAAPLASLRVAYVLAGWEGAP